MPKFEVQLARLVREHATVIIEAYNEEELEDRLKQVYDEIDDVCDDVNWLDDDMWGCEEGSHVIVRQVSDDEEVDAILGPEHLEEPPVDDDDE